MLRIELPGDFRVAVDELAVAAEAWQRSKAAGLVKLLAQHVDDFQPTELKPVAAAGKGSVSAHQPVAA